MALKTAKPMTNGQRQLTLIDRSELWKGGPVKSLTEGLTKTGGRNNRGRITTRHIGGGHKRRYRLVDFKRRKFDVSATIERLEYDPNRSAFIALITYEDKEQAYILAPQRVKAGDTVMSWCWARCQQMVSGPASRPWPASPVRRLMISSTVAGLIAVGEVFGRLDRGSNAASPSAS